MAESHPLQNSKNTLGDRIRYRRAALGVSAEELAKSAGVSAVSISKIQAGGGTRRILPIADRLKTTVRWLQTGADSQTDEDGNILATDTMPGRDDPNGRQGQFRPTGTPERDFIACLLEIGLSPLQMAAADALVKAMVRGDIDDTGAIEVISKYRAE